LLSLPHAPKVIELAELWADGSAERVAVWEAADLIRVAADGPDYDFTKPAVEIGLSHEDPYIAARYALPWIHAGTGAGPRCAELVRCVMGNPFRYRPPLPPLGPKVMKSTSVLWQSGSWAPNDTTLEDWLTKTVSSLFKRSAPKPHRTAEQVLPRSWCTSDVRALANQMYEARDFFAMPILADALQEAGCDNTEILDHCRCSGPHVRGCWVVDLVLGKQ
jgi:hypothetical protein